VFLVRSADAVAASPQLLDPDRYLTAAGRAAARGLGERLRWYDCVPTAVWTSPLIRAAQTAELMMAGLGWSGVIEAVSDLATDGDPRRVEAHLRPLRRPAAVVVIGHEPGLSALGVLLTGRDDFPALHRGEAARIDGGAIRWVFGAGDEVPRPVR